jgi:ketosteroid isomerase-like protein/quercetin dioxygenase-like cupin family protein
MNRPARISALTTFMLMAIVAVTSTAAAQSRDERAIRDASQAWQRYIARQQVDSIVALHMPDAIVMMANTPVVVGSNGVRAGWGEAVKLPGLDMKWTPQRIDVASPTRATEYGTYTESYDTPNGKAHDSGTYVTLWQKVNGKWRVALDAPVSSLPAPGTMPEEATDFVARDANGLAWSDFNAPGFAPGAKITVLHGDPSKAGRFVLRLSFPDGYQVPLHWHPTAEYVTVLSGGANFGMGSTVDMSTAHRHGPGDFVFIPARHAHFLTALGPTVVQVSGNGPFQLNLGAPK